MIREVAAEREKPALLFSGGKDSIVLVRLAQKAFAPGRVPFPLLHIDTGHNFPEVIEFRDRLVAERGLQLLVGSVQASIDAGRVREETGPRASRNRLQTVDAAGRDRRARARRLLRRRPPRRGALAREGARAVASATTSASGTRAASGPELWDLYNARVRRGEHLRAFPISNWTELDVWQYIASEELELPPIYMAHDARGVRARRDALRGQRRSSTLIDGEEPFTRVRPLPHRRRHELHRRGALARRRTLPEVVAEIAATNITERGETRADDRASEAAMEDRKREGYF